MESCFVTDLFFSLVVRMDVEQLQTSTGLRVRCGEGRYSSCIFLHSAESCYLGIILHETKGMSCAIESLATAASKAMWALFPRLNIAGVTGVSIKLRMLFYLVVPVMG